MSLILQSFLGAVARWSSCSYAGSFLDDVKLSGAAWLVASGPRTMVQLCDARMNEQSWVYCDDGTAMTVWDGMTHS